MKARIETSKRHSHPKGGLLYLFLVIFCGSVFVCQAQVNSGSDGHDGVLNPASNIVINMNDHPDGIYHYSSVNISNNVTVSFIPNANNTPVIWLVQSNCLIRGTINLDGKPCAQGGAGGPGGFAGGAARGVGADPGDGLGPGGGRAGITNYIGGSASHATTGGYATTVSQPLPGEVYGNMYAVPLNGGSGGGGHGGEPGGGGGGAILLAASGSIQLSNGTITAKGGGSVNTGGAGGGSGGTIRLVASTITGNGTLTVEGGTANYWVYPGFTYSVYAGSGWIRLDSLQDTLSGSAVGSVSRGYQPIIVPPPSEAISLSIDSVAGVFVAENPGGLLVSPDVIIPSNQQNPVPISVTCSNIPLNTEIVVEIKPANGSTIRAVGLNTVGTLATSTATIFVNMPRGGGTIQAKAVSGIADSLVGAFGLSETTQSLCRTGWTADGESFVAVEVVGVLGGSQQVSYLTESGKRYRIPSLN